MLTGSQAPFRGDRCWACPRYAMNPRQGMQSAAPQVPQQGPRPYRPSGRRRPARPGGVAHSLDEPKAAFRAGCGKRPLSTCGRDMLSIKVFRFLPQAKVLDGWKRSRMNI